ncbi:MAG TPA: class I SAM-dependent methyltransferase [Phycisphaerales bacterium]|nr:class I SAM-dependent methyltransferase [Phycisphaerales bacterium]
MAKPSAGDVDYALIGEGYASRRRADPRIEALVHAALGDARTVLNVGAGAGSYEPLDRYVIAIEPSEAMRRQRPRHLAPAIDARAEALPLDDRSVDASMAILTVHQWQDLEAGLRELKRVTRGPIVVMTFDGDALDRFWLADYVPELIEAERKRYPKIDLLVDRLSSPPRRATVTTPPIPIDCTDGFTEAFYARPEKFLDPSVLRSQSAWAFVSDAVRERFVKRLAEDLASGAWEEKYGEWRKMAVFGGALRLLAATAPH